MLHRMPERLRNTFTIQVICKNLKLHGETIILEIKMFMPGVWYSQKENQALGTVHYDDLVILKIMTNHTILLYLYVTDSDCSTDLLELT
jgi:hypothetical protein